MAAVPPKSHRPDSFATALRAVRILILLAIVVWFVSWIEYAVAAESPARHTPDTGFREAAAGSGAPGRNHTSQTIAQSETRITAASGQRMPGV
jgi:hypothetical protein